MADITASMVKELRETTGLGMMECKKALSETDGDMEKAIELLRVKSGAKANKAAGRVAAEGIIGLVISDDKTTGAIVEVNCETDFVAKNPDFIEFAKATAGQIVTGNFADVEGIREATEETRKALVMKLGENLTVRRFEKFNTTGKLVSYLHGSKIGVVVDLSGGDETLGKDIAMHIAASKPICVDTSGVDASLIANERAIFTAQAAESGKPANIVEKMVEGRIAKYLAEITLVGQPFVKNPDITVEKLLAEKGAKVNNFVMFTVGEGIEKKVSNFAEEVAAAAKV